jgi:hypothetical protein
MLTQTERKGPVIIVNEATGAPYSDKNVFGRRFRSARQAASVDGLTFHDLRRTATSEYSESGATPSEMGKINGLAPGSPAWRVYENPDKSTALAGSAKRFTKPSNKAKKP